MRLNELETEFKNIRLHLDEDSKNVRDLENLNVLYDSFFEALSCTQDAVIKYLKDNQFH